MFIPSGEWVIILKRNLWGYIKDFLHSLRFRIMVTMLIIGILPMLVIEHNVVKKYRESISENRTIEIQGYLNQIASKIADKNQYIYADGFAAQNELYTLSDIYDSRMLIVNNQMQIIADSYFYEEGKILISDSVVTALSTGRQTVVRKNQIVEIVVPIINSQNKVLGVIVADVNDAEFIINVKESSNELFVVRILLFLCIFVLSVMVSGMLVSPVKSITEAIEKFTEGHNISVNDDTYSEISKLSIAFNKLFGRMSKIDESRQEFVSNVSHELKTPLTSIKVLADSLNSQKDVPTELYREFMEDITNEIDRENKIIEDLLALVRMDKTASSLNVSRVNINTLIESVLKRLSPLAEKDNIEITYKSYRTVDADVDEVKFSLMLTNLVENAIKYNKADGWIKVSLNADYKYFYVQVEDSGIGIEPQQQEKVFERFYRVDKTRSRQTGGTGLGLAIAKSTVVMHNGSIKLESRENEGSKFLIRIPLSFSGGGNL